MRVFVAMLLTFMLSFLTSSLVFADGLKATNASAFDLNRASPEAMRKHQLGDLVIKEGVRIARAKYDFAVQGGAVGDVELVGEDGKSVVLPSGAVVVDCLIDVLTQGATSASGTISLGTGQADNDLKADTAAASYTGRVACVPVGTAATAIKLTADRTMVASIETGAISAGKFWVYVYYILGGT